MEKFRFIWVTYSKVCWPRILPIAKSHVPVSISVWRFRWRSCTVGISINALLKQVNIILGPEVRKPILEGLIFCQFFFSFLLSISLPSSTLSLPDSPTLMTLMELSALELSSLLRWMKLQSYWSFGEITGRNWWSLRRLNVHYWP